MSAPHAHTIISGYLRRLEDELGGLPRQRRNEILEDIEEHISDARAALHDESDDDLLQLLDRLGEPSAIAAEARSRFGVELAPAGVTEVMVVLLLGPGNFVVPLLSWFAGAILVWQSRAWTPRQKRISIYIPLLALLLVVGQSEIAPIPGFGHAYWAAAPYAVPLIASGYLAWHLLRRLPRVAWAAMAAATVVVSVPAVATFLPVAVQASVDRTPDRCGTFHGVADFGGALGAAVHIDVPYCATGTRVYATRFVQCPVSNHGTQWVYAHCSLQSNPDGSLSITVDATSRALTSVMIKRQLSDAWVIQDDGSLFDFNAAAISN